MSDRAPLLKIRTGRRLWRNAGVARDHLEIFPAEMVALVGSNGAGKTTLLRALSRMLPCTAASCFERAVD